MKKIWNFIATFFEEKKINLVLTLTKNNKFLNKIITFYLNKFKNKVLKNIIQKKRINIVTLETCL